MFIKLSTSLIVVFLFLTTVFATCTKDCSRTNYSFQMTASAVPDEDSIRIGDTIWIEVNEPVTLQDLKTYNNVNYAGAVNLGTYIGFQEIIGSVPQITNVAKDFDVKVNVGLIVTSSNPELFKEYLFTERDGKFCFKVGIVPRRSGTFRINLGSAANVYTSTNPCSKASIDFNFANTKQHFYLYPNGNGTLPGGGTYYFKVKS